MNDNQTIKAATPILHSYFSYKIDPVEAMDSLGKIFRLNSESAGERGNKGYRVTDPDGGIHEYPDAYSIHVERLELYVSDENNKTIAIFHRWEHVERIA